MNIPESLTRAYTAHVRALDAVTLATVLGGSADEELTNAESHARSVLTAALQEWGETWRRRQPSSLATLLRIVRKSPRRLGMAIADWR